MKIQHPLLVFGAFIRLWPHTNFPCLVNQFYMVKTVMPHTHEVKKVCISRPARV